MTLEGSTFFSHTHQKLVVLTCETSVGVTSWLSMIYQVSFRLAAPSFSKLKWNVLYNIFWDHSHPSFVSIAVILYWQKAALGGKGCFTSQFQTVVRHSREVKATGTWKSHFTSTVRSRCLASSCSFHSSQSRAPHQSTGRPLPGWVFILIKAIETALPSQKCPQDSVIWTVPH